MYCKNCGSEMSENAKKCSKCGEKFETSWGGISMFILIFISFAIPLIGIIFGLYGTYHKPKKTQGYILLGIGIIMIFVNILLSKYLYVQYQPAYF